MNEYELTVQLKVKIQAYNESDAHDAVLDTFGPGESCGVLITESEIL